MFFRFTIKTFTLNVPHLQFSKHTILLIMLHRYAVSVDILSTAGSFCVLACFGDKETTYVHRILRLCVCGRKLKHKAVLTLLNVKQVQNSVQQSSMIKFPIIPKHLVKTHETHDWLIQRICGASSII